MNARFNTYINGDVTLTLTPSRPVLRYATGGQTDEGWESSASTWTLDGDVVRLDWNSDGCDCDGRLSRGGSLVCPVGELRAREVDGVRYPNWRCADEDWQRDYQAEAAGY